MLVHQIMWGGEVEELQTDRERQKFALGIPICNEVHGKLLRIPVKKNRFSNAFMQFFCY
jgi:hypothetical protein